MGRRRVWRGHGWHRRRPHRAGRRYRLRGTAAVDSVEAGRAGVAPGRRADARQGRRGAACDGDPPRDGRYPGLGASRVPWARALDGVDLPRRGGRPVAARGWGVPVARAHGYRLGRLRRSVARIEARPPGRAHMGDPVSAEARGRGWRGHPQRVDQPPLRRRPAGRARLLLAGDAVL